MSSLLALLICVAAFAGPALSPVSDPDIWWHLKAGSEFLSGGPFPFQDTWSCTAPGRDWVNHEWLAEVLLALARRAAGDKGVVLFCALVLAVTAGLLFRAARLDGLPPAPTAILVCLGALAMSDRLTPRPQVFTYLCLALLLERLAAARRGGSPWILPLIQLFWTNLHGPLLGLVFGTLLVVGGGLPETGWKKRISLVSLLALASIVHPQGYRPLTDALPHLLGGGLYQQTIGEWLPIQHALQRVTPQAPAAFLIMGLGLLGATVGFLTLKGRRSFGYTVLLLLVAIAPLAANRHRDLIGVALTPGLAFLFPGVSPRLSWRYSRFFFLALAGAIVCIPGAGLLHYRAAWPPRFDLPEENFPEAGVAFLNRENIGSRMFNAYDYGGYLVDKLRKKRLDFIDGRYFVFGEEVYLDYLETRDGGERAEALIRRYDLDLLVIRYPQPDGYQALATRVREWPDWALVFWDDATLIYVRRDRVPPEWLVRKEYRRVDPTLPPAMKESSFWTAHFDDLVDEARRAEQDAPGAAKPRLVEALAFEYNARPQEAARAFREVLETHPGNRPAREGLKRLEDRLP